MRCDTCKPSYTDKAQRALDQQWSIIYTRGGHINDTPFLRCARIGDKHKNSSLAPPPLCGALTLLTVQPIAGRRRGTLPLARPSGSPPISIPILVLALVLLRSRSLSLGLDLIMLSFLTVWIQHVRKGISTLHVQRKSTSAVRGLGACVTLRCLICERK